jgi:hypothetical protein
LGRRSAGVETFVGWKVESFENQVAFGRRIWGYFDSRFDYFGDFRLSLIKLRVVENISISMRVI